MRKHTRSFPAFEKRGRPLRLLLPEAIETRVHAFVHGECASYEAMLMQRIRCTREWPSDDEVRGVLGALFGRFNGRVSRALGYGPSPTKPETVDDETVDAGVHA